MKRSLLAGPVVLGVALAIAGCDSAEVKPEPPHSAEVPVVKQGPDAPPPPIEPSPVPSLPPTTRAEEPKPAPEPKKEEPKKDEPKLEAPK